MSLKEIKVKEGEVARDLDTWRRWKRSMTSPGSVFTARDKDPEKVEEAVDPTTWETYANKGSNTKPIDPPRPLTFQLKVGISLIGGGLLVGGFVHACIAVIDLAQLWNATPMDCRLIGFNPIMNNNTGKVDDLLCGVDCRFSVRAANAQNVFIDVVGWRPEMHGKDDGKAWTSNDALRCCPTEPLEGCCSWLVGESFCDNWGMIVDASCPSGRWRCHIFSIDDHLNGEKGIVPPEALLEGDTRRAVPDLIVGLALVLAGCLVLSFLRRRVRAWASRPSIAASWCFCRLRLSVFRCVFAACPRNRKPEFIRREDAASYIQSRVRGWLARRKVREWLKAVETEQIKNSRRKGSENRVVTVTQRKVVAPPVSELFKPNPAPAQVHPRGLLYDTGEPNTFRRLVRARVASSPGDEIERIEVALAVNAPPFGAVVHFQQGLGLNSYGHAVVKSVKFGSFAFEHGLRAGFRMVKVGRLEWPMAGGEELLRELQQAPRPLFLVFEGTLAEPSGPPPFLQCPTPPLRPESRPQPPSLPPPECLLPEPPQLQPPRIRQLRPGSATSDTTWKHQTEKVAPRIRPRPVSGGGTPKMEPGTAWPAPGQRRQESAADRLSCQRARAKCGAKMLVALSATQLHDEQN